ncbi:MAG: C25 family cysteine peptidase [Planctomycetota bacterium]
MMIPLFATLLVGVLIVPTEVTATHLTGQWNQSDMDLVVVPENRPELLAVMTPALARLRHGENQPWLLSISRFPRPETVALLEHLAPESPLVLTLDWRINHIDCFPPPSSNFLQISPRLSRVSLFIARRFWEKTDQAVLASKDDHEAMILGSALAAHLAIPLIVYDDDRGKKTVEQTLDELQVDNVLLANDEADDSNHWANRLKQNIEHLDVAALEERLVTEIGREEVNAIVLARTPEAKNQTWDAPAWLAPYYSLIRSAPVAMTNSAEADEATSQVMRLIEKHDFSPRSVAILGDEESIEKRTVKIFDIQDEDSSQAEENERSKPADKVAYQVEVEPCMPSNSEKIPSFGVGRIPFSSVEQAATFLTRGFVRDQLVADTKPRAMIAANAAAERRGLPLSETMARLSAAEFKNVDLQTEEFYGDSIEGEKAAATAQQANLIIYHGHKGYEKFLPQALTTPASQPGWNAHATPEYHEYPEDHHYGTAHRDNPYLDQDGGSRQDTPHDRSTSGEFSRDAPYGRQTSNEPSRDEPYGRSVPDEPSTHEPYDRSVPDAPSRDEPYGRSVPDEPSTHEPYDRSGPDAPSRHEPYGGKAPDAPSRDEPYGRSGPDGPSTHDPYGRSVPDAPSRHESHGRRAPGAPPGHEPRGRRVPGEPSGHEPYDGFQHWEEDNSVQSGRETPSAQLAGLPVVILQSCSSLGERFLKRIHPFGGVAKIGTDTSVHSASGAAFVKAFADGLLYRDATLGEALRDARIYFFLLQKLKNDRGHTKQAKGQRAALSFQLWGDPELRVFPQGVEEPRRDPAEIEFIDSEPDALSISIPPGKDTEVRTDDYFARVFPDTQVAGIVMRTGDDAPRRVAPIHFFRKRLPEDIEKPPLGRLHVPGDDSIKAFFGIDELHQRVYVLYYPEEKKYTDKTFQLQFSKDENDEDL